MLGELDVKYKEKKKRRKKEKKNFFLTSSSNTEIQYIRITKSSQVESNRIESTNKKKGNQHTKHQTNEKAKRKLEGRCYVLHQPRIERGPLALGVGGRWRHISPKESLSKLPKWLLYGGYLGVGVSPYRVLRT